jgi:hypothetical protein
MTDDPTTKPCPQGRPGWNHGACKTCHGTGRVPMGTGEMWDALREWANAEDGAYVSISVGGGQDWTAIAINVQDDGHSFTVEGDLADALRAALRAVTG